MSQNLPYVWGFVASHGTYNSVVKQIKWTHKAKKLVGRPKKCLERVLENLSLPFFWNPATAMLCIILQSEC